MRHDYHGIPHPMNQYSRTSSHSVDDYSRTSYTYEVLPIIYISKKKKKQKTKNKKQKKKVLQNKLVEIYKLP